MSRQARFNVSLLLFAAQSIQMPAASGRALRYPRIYRYFCEFLGCVVTGGG